MVYNNIQPQQTANNTQRLMKRRSIGTPLRTCFSFHIRLLDDMLLLRDCLEYILHHISMLSIRVNNSTLFHPQQVRRESNRGEYRHPQAGRTDFHPADRQGKAHTTGKKKKATNICQHHRRHHSRLLGTKSHSSLGRFLHAPLTLMLKTPQ